MKKVHKDVESHKLVKIELSEAISVQAETAIAHRKYMEQETPTAPHSFMADTSSLELTRKAIEELQAKEAMLLRVQNEAKLVQILMSQTEIEIRKNPFQIMRICLRAPVRLQANELPASSNSAAPICPQAWIMRSR